MCVWVCVCVCVCVLHCSFCDPRFYALQHRQSNWRFSNIDRYIWLIFCSKREGLCVCVLKLVCYWMLVCLCMGSCLCAYIYIYIYIRIFSSILARIFTYLHVFTLSEVGKGVWRRKRERERRKTWLRSGWEMDYCNQNDFLFS